MYKVSAPASRPCPLGQELASQSIPRAILVASILCPDFHSAMPAGENVEPIMAAALHQEDIEEKKISLSAARHGHQAICRASGFHQDRDASVAGMLEPFPTPEELATLRRVPNKIPIKLFTIGFVELCERFSFYGTTAMCKLAQKRTTAGLN